MSLIDTAMKLHGYADAQREARRRDVQFAFQVVSWGVQAQENVSKLLDLREYEDTRDERQLLERKQREAQLDQAQMHRLNSYVATTKAFQEMMKEAQDNPEHQAAIGKMKRENDARFYNTTAESAGMLANPEMDDVKAKEYFEAQSVSLEAIRGKMSVTHRQYLDDTLETARLTSEGNFKQIAKNRPDPKTMARAVLRLREMPETVVDLTESDKERSKRILDRSISIYEENKDVDADLITKRVVAIQQAVQEMGDEPNEALKFALTLSVSEGLDQYVMADQQKVVAEFDGMVLSNRTDAAFAMAEHGVTYLATQDTASLLNGLKENDYFRAFSVARDVATSGKKLGEVRGLIEDAAGIDLLQAVGKGQLDPNGPEFRKQVYTATLNKIVMDAAFSGEDMTAVHRVAQQMKNQIAAGTLHGEGAMWSMLGAVHENIVRGLPDVMNNRHQHTAALQNQAHTNMRDNVGHTVARTTASGSEQITAIVPMTESGGALAARLERDALSLPLDLTRGESKTPGSQTVYANPLLSDNFFGAQQATGYDMVNRGQEALQYNAGELRRLVNSQFIGMTAGQDRQGQRPPVRDDQRRVVEMLQIIERDGYNAVSEDGEFSKGMQRVFTQRNFTPEQQDQIRRGLMGMRSARDVVQGRREGVGSRHTQEGLVNWYDSWLDVSVGMGLTNENLGIRSTTKVVQPKMR